MHLLNDSHVETRDQREREREKESNLPALNGSRFHQRLEATAFVG